MDANLAALFGMLIPWLLWVPVRWRTGPQPPVAPNARSFRLNDGMRWLGLFSAITGPGLVVLLAFVVPAEDAKPDDSLISLPVAALMGGLGSIVGIVLWRSVFRCDDAGLTAYSLWGTPRHLAWQDIRAITYCAGWQALRFDGGGRHAYVPVLLDDWPGFLAQLRRYLPHLELPAAVHADGEMLDVEGHFQSLYDHAHHMFATGAAVFILTLPFLTPYLPALALSAAGGAGLALFPLVRRFIPKPERFSAIIGNILQVAGWVAFSIFVGLGNKMFVAHLGGDEQMAAGVFWAQLGQNLSAPTMTAALLLLFARWRWPERFARGRMGRHEK